MEEMLIGPILLFALVIWLYIRILKIAIKATWNLIKILGYILMAVARPIFFIGIFTIGLGLYLSFPFLLLAIAFMLFHKAMSQK